MKIQGKVAIVTGGSSGIGQAIVKKLLDSGAKVVITYHASEEKAKKLQDEIDPKNSSTLLFGGDLADESAVRRLFSKTVDKFNRLDILVNCAGGVVSDAQLPNTTKAQWEKTFEANVYATVLCTQEAIKHMKPGSKIVNIGSVLGDRYGGREGIPAYSAAKAAVHNFTQTIAKQLVPDILVNAISPGRTITDAYDNMSQEDRDALGSVNKINRWIQPEEIADAVDFALRNDAIVGEIISVDAGFFFFDSKPRKN